MLCGELMNSDPVSVLPDTTVQKAALLMCAKNIGFLPVCDASNKVLGTVTDRDIAIRNVADPGGGGRPRGVLRDPGRVAGGRSHRRRVAAPFGSEGALESPPPGRMRGSP